MKKCKHPCCGQVCRKIKLKKARTPIKKRSEKMTRIMEIYKRKRVAFLRENPVCVVTGKPSTEIHHGKGRIGRDLLNESFWKAVSREGHTWIEEHPEEAKRLGFSYSRLSKV
jgi:hypothetical protein